LQKYKEICQICNGKTVATGAEISFNTRVISKRKLTTGLLYQAKSAQHRQVARSVLTELKKVAPEFLLYLYLNAKLQEYEERSIKFVRFVK
jgi:hypothetical protein